MNIRPYCGFLPVEQACQTRSPQSLLLRPPKSFEQSLFLSYAQNEIEISINSKLGCIYANDI